MHPLRRSTIVLSLAAAALAASPALGLAQEAAKEAPTQVAAEPAKAGPIDAKAAAIYERGVQAVRAYRTLEMTSQTKIEGMEEMAGMLPAGFDAKHRVVFRANAADAAVTQVGGAMRIEQLDDTGVGERHVLTQRAQLQRVRISARLPLDALPLQLRARALHLRHRAANLALQLGRTLPQRTNHKHLLLQRALASKQPIACEARGLDAGRQTRVFPREVLHARLGRVVLGLQGC